MTYPFYFAISSQFAAIHSAGGRRAYPVPRYGSTFKREEVIWLNDVTPEQKNQLFKLFVAFVLGVLGVFGVDVIGLFETVPGV